MEHMTMKELLEGPGLKPPPGVNPNFNGPVPQYNSNIAVNSLCLILATICVAIRAYTRFFIMRMHGWEDYTCFIAFVGLIAYVTLMLTPIIRNHAGMHQWDIQGKDLMQWIKVANGIEIAYIPTIFIAKLSILLLLLRIFVPGGRTKTWWAVQSLIVFNLLFYLSNLPIEIWPCIPRSKLWNPLKEGHCINNEAVFVAGGAINMVSDFMLILIPLVHIWRLKMPLNRRIGISAIFATGIFCCIASIMHLATSVLSAKSKDKTYYLFSVGLWTVAEVASAIVVGCLITMPNFFRYFTPMIASKISKTLYGPSRGISSAQGTHRFPSFVPERAKPEDWSPSHRDEATMRDKDTYLELGESNTWTEPPKPAMIHQGESHGTHGVTNRWGFEHGSNGFSVTPLPAKVAVARATNQSLPRPESPHLYQK